jgi:hypothetical protein
MNLWRTVLRLVGLPARATTSEDEGEQMYGNDIERRSPERVASMAEREAEKERVRNEVDVLSERVALLEAHFGLQQRHEGNGGLR